MLMPVCGKIFGIGVELDVVFRDSTLQCRYLYVLSPNAGGINDTLAVFDTLSFNGQSRVSLFYAAECGSENMLSMVDSSGLHIESSTFKVSRQRTVFAIMIGRQQIKVAGKDYIYPQKNEDERSYFVFLFIFFVVKILITAVFVFSSKLPKRTISISSGAILLSAFVDWFLPMNYLYRFLIIILAEYLLIALVGRRSISWLQAALLVLVVNIVGFGLIAVSYLSFVFW
jgi:hypothetical protein